MQFSEFNALVSSPISQASSNAELFVQIAAGDEGAFEVLYSLIGRAVRAKVRREFPCDHEDMHHSIFLDIVAAIRAGTIRNPDSLLSFIRTICRRRSGDLIRARIAQREGSTVLAEPVFAGALPDQIVIDQERKRIAVAAVEELPELHRRIVTQFYLEEKTQDEIIAENDLSETQFRLNKSRALKKMQMNRNRGRTSSGRKILLRVG